MNKEVKKLMEKNGFVLIRDNKHLVWRHVVKGVKVITPKTPSTNRVLHHVKKHIRQAFAFHQSLQTA